MLLARCEHQQRFGTQTCFRLRIEQDFAQGFAGGRAARFAGKQYRKPSDLKPLLHHSQVGGLARSVYAVEGNESGVHVLTHKYINV